MPVADLSRFQQLLLVSRRVRNPLPLLLDRAGLQQRPYILDTRDGLRFHIRPGRGDRYTFYETVLRGDYLRDGPYLRPGDTIIDAGANIGCFAVLAGRIVGRSGCVLAVEPEEHTYTQLVSNIALNRQSHVIARRLALAGQPGTVTLRVARVALFSSLFEQVNGQLVVGAQQEVQAVALEQLMDEAGITRCDCLKLDCEGAEYDIFESMSPTAARRISQIIMEVHRVRGHDSVQLRERLLELGFEVRAAGELLLAWRTY